MIVQIVGWIFCFAYVLARLGMSAINLACTPSTVEMLFPFVDGVPGNIWILLGNSTLGSRLLLFVKLVLVSSSSNFTEGYLLVPYSPIINFVFVRN